MRIASPSRTAIAITFVASLGLMAAPAAQAEASSAATASSAACELHIGLTRKDGNYIRGYGSKLGCENSTSWLYLQWERWNGWWTQTEKAVNGSGFDVPISWFCKGTGTHNFKVRHYMRTLGGATKVKDSNIIRVTC
ncbi:hypothetical protein AB0K48_47775 [Nonomuraea sp. NPDC055795]